MWAFVALALMSFSVHAKELGCELALFSDPQLTMRERFVGEEVPKYTPEEIRALRQDPTRYKLLNNMRRLVPYMSTAARDKIEVEIGGDGRLYWKQTGELVQTEYVDRQPPIFVAIREGQWIRIFVLAEFDPKVHRHSTISAGQPVIMAGHLTVSDGTLTMINNKSGHYAPSRAVLDHFVEYLRAQGADVSRTAVEYFVPSTDFIEKN